MKPETKRAGAIIIGSVCILSAILLVLIVVGVINGTSDFEEEQLGFAIAFVAIVCTALLAFGISTLVIGLRAYKSMKKGRAREGKIVDISNINGRYFYKAVTISYYGESGEKYELVFDCNVTYAEKLKVGQYIECFVLGETCYVNTDNIKVVREAEEELNFE